jgi:TRAP transporter T-component
LGRRRADRLRQRARYLYLRARNLALHSMRANHDDGIDAAIKGGEDAVRKYLKDHYNDASDNPSLFWAGLAWGAAINMSLDQPDLIADLPMAIAFVERSVELDDKYFNGGGYLFLATAEAAMPPPWAGTPTRPSSCSSAVSPRRAARTTCCS